MNISLTSEQSCLIMYRDIMLSHGYIVERTERYTYSGATEVCVRFFNKQSKEYSPVFQGQYTGPERSSIYAAIYAEIVAIIIGARSYGIHIETQTVEEVEPAPDAGDVSRHAIMHSMGSAVSDVENALLAMGVDMTGYNVFRDKLKRQSKRITKERLAEYFFPTNGKPRLTLSAEQKKAGAIERPPLPTKTFKAIY